MTLHSLRGIACSEPILVPQNEAAFIDALRQLVPLNQQQRAIDKGFKMSAISIQHKLSVAMYHAALINNLNPIEFVNFEEQERHQKRPDQPSEVVYKGCHFQINDIYEFRLFLSLFVETFAATATSLFDVTGHLLHDLYDLAMPVHRIDYDKVVESLKSKPIYSFLVQYQSPPRQNQPTPPTLPLQPQPTRIHWIKPLREIRNRTTHRPFTELYRAKSVHEGNVYESMMVTEAEFLLDDSLFQGQITQLPAFIMEVFDGLEYFTEELYRQLCQVIAHTQQQNGGLPLI